MTSKSAKQTIAIHIFPYISRNKANHTMIIGQLIDHNMKHFA